ncbi:MAG: polyphosphate kinase 2, partial [Rhodoferax sp.]|nr:polyphosphate kinase 2 [Rhodoferax sp.]
MTEKNPILHSIDGTPAVEPARKAAKKRRTSGAQASTEKTRRTAQGDVSGAKTARGISKSVTQTKLRAAQGAQQNALKDVLAHTGDKASALKALLAGSSPDDVAAIRKMLMDGQILTGKKAGRPDEELAGDWRTGAYPYKNLLSRKQYEAKKYQLQVELLKLQIWAKETGQRIVILFEGRDAAGKGGTIKRLMEHLNPRGARVVALEKPTDTERGQWYFQRYVQHLPTSGEIVLFDRSWYNRAGVERVMGFCSEAEYQEFIRQVP